MHVAIAPDSRVPLPDGGFTQVSYHNLTFTQFGNVLNAVNLPRWAVHCLDNNVSCGGLCGVVGAGVGNATFTFFNFGPFQTPA
jgi:hypothetical protein